MYMAFGSLLAASLDGYGWSSSASSVFNAYYYHYNDFNVMPSVDHNSWRGFMVWKF